MMQRHPCIMYFLLSAWIAISFSYYVFGVAALADQRFHNTRPQLPFGIEEGKVLRRVTTEAKAAGLRDGDILVLFDGVRFTGDYQATEYLRSAKTGASLTIGVRSASSDVKTATIRLVRRGKEAWTLGNAVYLILVVTVPLVCLLAGYWIVAARPTDPNAWLALVILTFPETAFSEIGPWWWGGSRYCVFLAWEILGNFAGIPALVWFGLLFPERSRIDRWMPWLKWLLLATQVCAFGYYACYYYLDLFAAYNYTAGWIFARTLIDRIFHWGSTFCILVFLAAVFDNLRSASTADARRRLRVLAVGSALSLGPVLIHFGLLPLFGYDPHRGWLLEVITPFILFFPLTLAYVLIVQRAMELQVLLRMGTKYLLAQATLNTVLIFVSAYLISRLVLPVLNNSQHPVTNVLLIAMTLGLVIWEFIGSASLNNRLQRWLDCKFFREAYNAEVVLSDLSEQVHRLTEKTALLDTMSHRISEVLHVPQIAIWLRASNAFHLQQALGFTTVEPAFFPEHSVTVENLATTNRPATVYRDRPAEWLSRAGAEERSVLERLQTEVLLPLPGRERLVGVIALGPKRSEEPYTPSDLRLLQAVATQTGLALEVTELARSLTEEAALRALSERELEIAHEVQERLFPQQMPAVPGVNLAGFCRPARGVGGDYYDAFQLADGRLGLAIGDVSGKGIPAALLMASLRACLRTMTLVGPADLAQLMQKMNQLVYEASAVNRYATFFFAIYEPVNRTLTYVNAGHNPPFLLRGSSKDCLRLSAGGPVVGLLPNLSYTEESVTLRAGDVLLAYTDGISEAMTAEDEEWGEDGMLSAANVSGDRTADDLMTTIFEAADRFTGKAPQHDDMTLLVAKFT